MRVSLNVSVVRFLYVSVWMSVNLCVFMCFCTCLLRKCVYGVVLMMSASMHFIEGVGIGWLWWRLLFVSVCGLRLLHTATCEVYRHICVSFSGGLLLQELDLIINRSGKTSVLQKVFVFVVVRSN